MTEGDGVIGRDFGAVKRQKLATESSTPPARMSAEKALAIAFGRAGRQIPGLGLRMAGFSRELRDLAEIAPDFTPGSLALLLRQKGEAGALGRPGHAPPSPAMTEEGGPMHGGLVLADAGLISSLVEARMTGHVSPARPGPRNPTRIDALILSGLVDAALDQFDLLVPDLSIADRVSAWRAGAMVTSAASARLTLADGDFLYFALEFDLGEGLHHGRLVLAMPDRPPPRREAEIGAAAGPGALAEVVLQARSDLRAILARMQVPLSRLSLWEAGDTIPIPRAALTGVRIEDIEGTVVGRGRLGQLSGARAIRISGIGIEDVPEMTEQLSMPPPEAAYVERM